MYSYEERLRTVQLFLRTGKNCMAHARRKFFELFAANKSHLAQSALEQFNAIYAVEAQLQELVPDERHMRRQADIKPLMDKLRQWLLDHKIKVPDGSGTMKAIDHSLKRWMHCARSSMIHTRLLTTIG